MPGIELRGTEEQDARVSIIVQEALHLPVQYRAPLILFHLQGLRVDELAEILHLTPSNAKVRLHRARKMLRERLERRGKPP